MPDSHPILRGIPADMPYVLGYNKLKRKEGAQVLIENEGDVILAAWEWGKGRVAAYAPDCAPHWAPKAMTEWEAYPKFWDNMVRYLGGETQV